MAAGWSRIVVPLLIVLALQPAFAAGPMHPDRRTGAQPIPTSSQYASIAPAARRKSALSSLLTVIGPGGIGPALASTIAMAKQRILVEAFALSDPAVIGLLEQAERRGVDVRVMLDPRGLNSASTDGALQAAGIRTRAPNPAYSVTHLNAVVVDAAAVVVLTSALTTEGLGGLGGSYAIVDRDRTDVLQAASLFYDDWLRRPVARYGHNLMILPDDSSGVSNLLASARLRVELYTSYLSDGATLSALQSARQRGASVRVLTPGRSNNNTLRGIPGPGDIRFRDEGAGTMLVIDRHTVLIGSMDLSSYTIANHRELGVVVADPSIASRLSREFFDDFSHGVVLTVPRVKKPAQHTRQTNQSVSLRVDVTPRVRLGGEGVVAVSTNGGARVDISVVYPSGSNPAGGTTGISGYAHKDGSFIYRWIVTGRVNTGIARVLVIAQFNGQRASASQAFTLVK